MTKEMYLLAICDNIRESCVIMLTIMAAVMMLLGVFYGVCHDREIEFPRWGKFGIGLTILTAITCTLFLAFIPSTNSIIKAYCIKEGSKIVTAENIKDMSKEISSEAKKITDAVVERIKK